MDPMRSQDMLELKDDKRPIRRVRSPSRPRAWLAHTYKSKFTGHSSKPHLSRDNRSFYKPALNSRSFHHPVNRRPYVNKGNHSQPKIQHKRNHCQPKIHPTAPRQRDHDRELDEWYEPKESADASSPLKQNSTSRPFLSRSSSSRDKDTQFNQGGQSDRNQSRERDHRGSKSKDRERSRDGENPSTVSQTTARDRAIQQKRREIDEVYYQECETFGLVTKMLIEKDPSLEQPIQLSLQENLRDIGNRCVEAMQKFIEDYDSRELLH